MKLLLIGPLEGHLNKFYKEAMALSPQWVVCAGDYGVWPDPMRMDRASKKHAGQDFSRMYVGADATYAWASTLLISGVHDDNEWLKKRHDIGNTVILGEHVHWLAQGFKTNIGWELPLRVTGLGKAYSEATYKGQFSQRSSRHYTRSDVERACSSGPTDLLVIYEHLDAPGIKNVIYATRPKLILSIAHPNRKKYTEIQQIPVIQLGRGETRLVEWDEQLFSFNVLNKSEDVLV